LEVGPLTARGLEWANGVLSGDVVSGELARLAVERFYDDLQRAAQHGIATDPFPYEFDPDESERWLEFTTETKHVKDRWAGKPFQPSGYQCFVTSQVYGWRLREDAVDEETGEITPAGTRRFLQAYIEVCRKNGKSTWMAALGLGHLCIDGVVGAEVYTGATTEKQAWEVFGPARRMCVNDPEFCDRYGIEVAAKSLWRPSDGSKFVPIIGNPGHGPSPSCSITDEYHQHKDRKQVEAMETGMGARQQPVAFKITTAGSDLGGPCFEEHQEAEAILRGTLKNDTKFAIIFAADTTLPWDSDIALKQGNPNLGVSVSRRYLVEQRNAASNSPVKQASFKTLHLDQWVGAGVAAFNLLRLQRCVDRKAKLEDFKGAHAYIGADLATRFDIASIGIVLPEPDLIRVFCKHWAPHSAVYGTGEVDPKNPNYRGWADAGWLNVTDGNTIDLDLIENEIARLCEFLSVPSVAYDPYQATQMATHLGQKSITMIEIRPTPMNFSEPMDDLEQAIVDRTLRYDGDPVLTWMFGNTVARTRGNLGDLKMPGKEREEQKIDGVVAILMAWALYLAEKQEGMPPGYELLTV